MRLNIAIRLSCTDNFTTKINLVDRYDNLQVELGSEKIEQLDNQIRKCFIATLFECLNGNCIHLECCVTRLSLPETLDGWESRTFAMLALALVLGA